MQARNYGAIVPAIILIGVGIFFLLVNTQLIRVGIGQLWPIFPVLLGAGLLAQFFMGRMRDPGLITGGTIFLLTGLVFFLFTLNLTVPGLGAIHWGNMAQLWPVFPTIVGVALLLQWIAGGLRERDLLIPIAILLTVGLGGFAFTLGGLPTFRLIADYWPVALIVLGVIVLARSFMRPRSLP
jgi:hypothetical protein